MVDILMKKSKSYIYDKVLLNLRDGMKLYNTDSQDPFISIP